MAESLTVDLMPADAVIERFTRAEKSNEEYQYQTCLSLLTWERCRPIHEFEGLLYTSWPPGNNGQKIFR